MLLTNERHNGVVRRILLQCLFKVIVLERDVQAMGIYNVLHWQLVYQPFFICWNKSPAFILWGRHKCMPVQKWSLHCILKVCARSCKWKKGCSRISSNLSGSLKSHLCCTALLKMTEDRRASVDIREAVAVVAVDLRKTFVSICHPLLLTKLQAYGFTDNALELMTVYFWGRRKRVKIGGVYSQWRAISASVPPGSLFDPLLFTLYVSDLNYFVSNTSLRL